MNLSKEKKEDKNSLTNLSSIQKILLLQRLLKEMTSIKQRFMENTNKMLKKLDDKCVTYFKNKIYMKEIFDYCILYSKDTHKEYELIKDCKNYFNDIYQSLYDFYFLIRNDNSLILKIIELCDKDAYEELSDFIVNFLYGNTIKSSFSEDELMVIIYLLIEKFFLTTLPNFIDINSNISLYLKNHILFNVFKALTRKIDLRNFLCSILSDFILRLENLIMPLSVDINIINRYLSINDRIIYNTFFRDIESFKEEEIHRNKKKFKKIDKNEGFFKRESSGSLSLQRKAPIILGKSVKAHNNNVDKKDSKQNLMTLEDELDIQITEVEETEIDDNNCETLEKEKTELENNDSNNNVNNNVNLEKKEDIIDDLKVIKNKSETKNNKLEDLNLNLYENKSDDIIKNENEDIDENGQVKIDIFFEKNSITIEKLENYLSKYEKKDDKSSINSAMKEYLNILLSKIKNEEFNDKNNNKGNKINNQDSNHVINDNKEIFSNSLIIDELKNQRDYKQPDSFRKLMKKIKLIHLIITKIIGNIINFLKDNLISSPNTLKCIARIINILLNKKYNDLSKNKLSDYQTFMFEINFLIGSIILPILKNPEFNGIVFTNVISEMTRENLSIISDIIETMISGKLFNKKDKPYMTIFNKFIIKTLPKLFELVGNFEKNFELNKNINNLINTYDNKNNQNRNINYDYFKENPNENINYQSICFSLKNLFFILQTIIKNKKILIDENQNKEQKFILQNFVNSREKYTYYFTRGLQEQKFEFFYITKIFYHKIFEKKIKEIIQDNFIYLLPKENDDLITAFKKCINEILSYANKIQIEHFYELTERKDVKTFKPKKFKNLKKEEENQRTTTNKSKKKMNLKKSLIKISKADKEDDADFKNILFPQIKNNINLEINYNLDNNNAQRIIFCTNFLNLYMKNIPKNYKNNNYSLLFDELINETRNNIEYLKTNALFEFYKKIKESEKLNMMNSSYSSQIKDLEKLKVIEYLYNKLLLPTKLIIKKDQRKIISSIEYEKDLNSENNNINKDDDNVDVLDYLKSLKYHINHMIEEFPDFHQYEEEYDNILDIEEKAFTPDALRDYFSAIKKLVKKESIIKRYDKNELKSILIDLENYILSKFYHKLFPFESTKEDVKFYKKCKRLEFIKPENVVKDKNIINEKLCEKAIQYFDNLDEKLTPIDKIKTIGKAFDIIQKSISFSAGKDKLGTDDILDPFLFVVIKAKPKNIFANYKYCELYLNQDLSKTQYGIILQQFYTVISHIKNMKNTDLIGVSEEQFGKDEIEGEI